MAECEADDRACWENEWYWNNRWYEAHGWFADKDGWTRPGDPKMQDADIARDVLAEAGIHLSSGGWGQAEIMEMAQGVARFGQKLSRGLVQLRELLGASVSVRDWS